MVIVRGIEPPLGKLLAEGFDFPLLRVVEAEVGLDPAIDKAR